MSKSSFKLDKVLMPLWKKVREKKPLYKALSGIMLDAVEKNFETEGKRLGTRWADLKPSTIKQRMKQKKWPGKILQRSAGSDIELQKSKTWEGKRGSKIFKSKESTLCSESVKEILLNKYSCTSIPKTCR